MVPFGYWVYNLYTASWEGSYYLTGVTTRDEARTKMSSHARRRNCMGENFERLLHWDEGRSHMILTFKTPSRQRNDGTGRLISFYLVEAMM